jgi:HPt (histidine-containing phosphotransfer) domain-containing protein
MAVIRKAIQKKNAESLAAAAHALKGSVSNFGAGGAERFAEELQARGRGNDFRRAGAVYDCLEEEIAKLEANLRGYAGTNKKKAFSRKNLQSRQTKKRKG